MDLRDCYCGCDSFRFKTEVDDKQPFSNLCRNCNHALSAHLHLPSVEQ